MDNVRYVNRELPGGTQIIDPLSLNLYAYCASNPVMYADPSGNAWEIVLDIVSAGISLKDYLADPSLTNASFLLWDVGGALIPFVPGSYVAKGAKLVVRTDKASDLAELVGKLENVSDWVKILSETASSRVLRENMIKAGITVPDYANAAHHIVAGGAEGTLQARQILWKFGISVNDAVNGVFLPNVKGISDATYHNTLHTKEYYEKVNMLLKEAETKEDAITVLKKIPLQLENGTFID